MPSPEWTRRAAAALLADSILDGIPPGDLIAGMAILCLSPPGDTGHRQVIQHIAYLAKPGQVRRLLIPDEAGPLFDQLAEQMVDLTPPDDLEDLGGPGG